MAIIRNLRSAPPACSTSVVNFTSTSSNTGPRDFKIQYATAAGGPYTDTDVTYINQPSAGTISWSSSANFYHPGHDKWVDLTSISALDDQASLFFRFVDNSTTSANGGTVATGGTSRIDNVTFLADYVPQIYGDFNDNKTVDAADYIPWRKGSCTPYERGSRGRAWHHR